MEILKQINDILSNQNLKIYVEEKNGMPMLKSVMDSLAKCWCELSEDLKDGITNLLLGKKPEYLLGDVKWILYQHIISLNDKDGIYTIRSGNFAFDKISKFSDSKYDYCNHDLIQLNINGEKISVIKVDNKTFDKKKIIISKNITEKDFYHKDSEEFNTIFPDDIILYFV